MMQPFVHSAPGIAVMAVVGVLVFCGALSIRKIIRIDI